MGFFSPKVECAVCGKETGLNRYQLANKEWICPSCFKSCGYTLTTPIKTITSEQAKQALIESDEKAQVLEAFTPTKKIANILELDENKRQVIFHTGFFGGRGNSNVYNYSDIVAFELLENGSSITKGGLGGAVAGGLLFGGVGAIVGGITGGKKSNGVCNSLKIKITINNISNPAVYINLINTQTKTDSFTYKTLYKSAQDALSTLQIICDTIESEKANITISQSNIPSVADEILKFKKLLDDGVITQEEFDAKKKQLLGV